MKMLETLLLQYKSEINAQNSLGDTALHTIMNYDIGLTSLCSNSATKNKKKNNFITTWTAKLLRSGANLDIKNSQNKTAIDYACLLHDRTKNKWNYEAPPFHGLEPAFLLLVHGATVMNDQTREFVEGQEFQNQFRQWLESISFTQLHVEAQLMKQELMIIKKN
jgi:hypothetical protein